MGPKPHGLELDDQITWLRSGRCTDNIYIYIDIDIDIDIDMVRQADIRILSSAVQNRCVSICVCWSCCTAGRA